MIIRILKGIGWSLVDLVLFLLFTALIMAVFLGIFTLVGMHPFSTISVANITEETSPYPILFINYLPLLIALVAASILAHGVVFKRPYLLLGYGMVGAGSLFGRGWLWSLIMIIPAFLLLWVTHQLSMLPATWHGWFLLGYLIFFFIQSAGEEVLTRAYLISMLETRLGTLVALILSGSLFALLHIGNDHFTWIGFANILLGGLIMALLFVIYRSVWVCTGYHAGWNFIQAGLLDFNVSGVDVYSLIQWNAVGYPRLTGSSFGYEGSLIAVLFQSVLLIYLFKNHKIEYKNPFTKLHEVEAAPEPEAQRSSVTDTSQNLWQ